MTTQWAKKEDWSWRLEVKGVSIASVIQLDNGAYSCCAHSDGEWHWIDGYATLQEAQQMAEVLVALEEK